VIGRLVRAADFERALGTRPAARSTHFAVHHVAGGPAMPKAHRAAPAPAELSTGGTHQAGPSVDDSAAWTGVVVPKRHARRAVTRSLLKRQMRAAFGRAPQLPGGLWVLRLRAPFDRAQFVSAASDALRAAARSELAGLLDDAVRRRAASAR